MVHVERVGSLPPNICHVDGGLPPNMLHLSQKQTTRMKLRGTDRHILEIQQYSLGKSSVCLPTVSD